MNLCRTLASVRRLDFKNVGPNNEMQKLVNKRICQVLGQAEVRDESPRVKRK